MSRQPNIAKGTPGKVLFGFALLVVLVAWTALSDRLNREELEGFDFPTGVADAEFAPLPASSTAIVANLEGIPFFKDGDGPIGRRDAFMVRYARDDSGMFFLYRDTPTREESGSAIQLYVKVERNKYMPLTAKPTADTSAVGPGNS